VNGQNIALIGKMIQAVTLDEKMQPAGYVEGRVDNLRFIDGQGVLIVGGRQVKPGEVISVADEGLLLGKQLTISVVNADGTGSAYHTGPIEGIRISAGNTYVKVSGQEAKIPYIDELTEAVNSAGSAVKLEDGTAGIMERALVKGGKVYAVVNDGTALSEALFSEITIQ
jgi:hypothetical protein